jgi:putative salt-induced outer membrane protein
VNHSHRTKLAALCLLWAAPALAQEAAPAAAPAPTPPPAWTGTAQVSFLKTTGNTETSVLGVGGDAKYKGASPWSIAMKAALARGEADGVENLRKFQASVRGGRAFNERTDAFIEAAYAEDIYAGIDSRYGGEAGVSHKLTLTGKHLLSVEAGFGAIHEVRLPGKLASDFATARGGLNYKFVISKTADFQNQTGYTANLSESADWRLTNAAALTAALNSRFSMKLSYNVAHLNTPPPGKEKTDTTAAAALVAKF